MVLNHPLPLCANTFVLLRDSARCVMSIHNARSEAMNVKSPVYTGDSARTEAAKYHFSSRTVSLGRSLHPRANRGRNKKAVLSPLPVFVPRWSMQVAAGAIQIVTRYEMSNKKSTGPPRWGIHARKRGPEKIFCFLSGARGWGREREGGKTAYSEGQILRKI